MRVRVDWVAVGAAWRWMAVGDGVEDMCYVQVGGCKGWMWDERVGSYYEHRSVAWVQAYLEFGLARRCRRQ
jgi:hypothetical protein